MDDSPPLVGITTYGRDEKDQFVLPAKYVESVRRAGGVPLLLAPGETRVDRWLDCCDAVVLGGGGDIDPRLYGGRDHETVYMVDEERDVTKLDFAKRLIASEKPVLGICRGAQVINVALGGSLHEHVPDVVGEGILHRLPPREPTPHRIVVEPNTRLAGIVRELEFDAESWHHQSIRDLAPELIVTARAPDGIIEAVEQPEHRWLVAVQWHPELTAETDTVQQRIFDAIVEVARAASAKRKGTS